MAAENVDPIIRAFNGGLIPEQRTHIELRPQESGGYVVARTYPGEHHLEQGIQPLTPDEAVQHVDITQDHFQRLREEGIVVPRVEFDVVRQATGDVVVRSEVEFIPTTPFTDPATWRAQGQHAPYQREAIGLATSLTSYFDTLAASKSRACLGDVARIEQYGVTSDNRVALLDTDPLVHQSLPPSRWSTPIKLSLYNLRAWTNVVQPKETAWELFGVIQEVLDTRDV